jgi:hypothetical protein
VTALSTLHAVASIAATALVVIALALRIRGDRRALAVGLAAAALLAGAFASGLALDAPYRQLVRQRLFVVAPAVGWLFERKLHLAFGATLLGGAAAFADLAAGRVGDAATASFCRAARVAAAASAVLAIAATAASFAAAPRMRPFESPPATPAASASVAK